jgi:hypothetical protein
MVGNVVAHQAEDEISLGRPVADQQLAMTVLPVMAFEFRNEVMLPNDNGTVGVQVISHQDINGLGILFTMKSARFVSLPGRRSYC